MTGNTARKGTGNTARKGTGPHVYLGRYLTGMHLDGRRRTDATFFRRGLQVTEPHWFGQRAAWWSMLAGWHRAAMRWAAVALIVGVIRWRHQTEWAAALVLAPLAAYGAVRSVQRAMLARHQRTLVRPLSAALAPYLGLPPLAVESSLTVRRDYADAETGEHLGALGLPDHWAATPDQRKVVEQVIDARFGVDLRYQWRTASYPMVLNMTRAPVPPALVAFTEWREAIAAYPLHRVMLGLNADGEPRDWDSSAEDPHIAIHGGSRRGKTSLLLLIAAQELFKGAELVAGVDPKRVSLTALAGIPGVRLYNNARDVQSMWDGIAEFRELVESRYDALAADPTLEFRRALLIIDEISMFAGMSKMHWRTIKASSDPATPPVWQDVAAAVWMGAQCRCHVVVAGQRLDYDILGGMLGSFGVRLLAGYTPQDYARLVGIPPFQRSQKPRGRFLLYEGGETTWLQLIKTDDPDRDYTALRDFAMAGALRHARGASDLGAMTGTGTPDAALIVGLAAAAELLGMEPETFRKGRQRRPVPGELTDPDGRPAWPAEALTSWRESRPSAVRGAS